MRARDRHPSIQLAGQCLIVPTVLVYSGPQSVPSEWAQKVVSHQENAEAPVFGEKDWQKYLSILNVPESEQKKGENFPVWADLKGLPPTYLAMDGPDPIRDEGYLYEDSCARQTPFNSVGRPVLDCSDSSGILWSAICPI
ncbi:hypothetical protein EWS82_13200, partial [Staphylococcus xylosus]|nr:hypothetical protein [Staphylococcus xylosus]